MRQLQLIQPSVKFQGLVVFKDPVTSLSLSLSYPCPNLLNDPQLCVPLECQQEEASQHSEAGSRLPWQRRAGAASLGGFGRSASEL